MGETRSGAARWTIRLAAFACNAVVIGPLAAHAGLLSPMVGFLLFDLGGLVAVLTFGLGLFAVLRGQGPERRAALAGFLPCLLIVAVFVILAGRARQYPRINDITTDPVAPPQFVQAGALPGNAGRDLAYPPHFRAQQEAGYPTLGPLRLPLPRDAAFARVREAARAMPSWTITREDAAAYALEGVDTSWLFRFQDDFAIEVRPADGESVVHMRSKSRDGRGDLGANAQRIRAFFARLQ
jgi:uncharacterized protein (DUF1499 family)